MVSTAKHLRFAAFFILDVTNLKFFILAHPNCKLFISHGGLLSTTETINFGVPVLALPVFGDQKMNAVRITSKGFGLTISFSELTEERLRNDLDELLGNPM